MDNIKIHQGCHQPQILGGTYLLPVVFTDIFLGHQHSHHYEFLPIIYKASTRPFDGVCRHFIDPQLGPNTNVIDFFLCLILVVRSLTVSSMYAPLKYCCVGTETPFWIHNQCSHVFYLSHLTFCSSEGLPHQLHFGLQHCYLAAFQIFLSCRLLYVLLVRPTFIILKKSPPGPNIHMMNVQGHGKDKLFFICPLDDLHTFFYTCERSH